MADRIERGATVAARDRAVRSGSSATAGDRGKRPPRRATAAQEPPYEMMKRAIIDGTLAPGAQLVEVQLAQWCGVSRTPIREALSRLQHDGLIERDDRGFIVKERSPEEILDIYEVRIELEALAARTAAERCTRLDVMRIERGLKDWDAAGEDASADDRVQINQRFHRAVWQASHSEPLLDLLERLSLHLTRYPATTLTAPGRHRSALDEHRQLAEAITARDGDAAAEAARLHFRAALQIRLSLYEQEIV